MRVQFLDLNKKQKKFLGVLLVLLIIGAAVAYLVLIKGNTNSLDASYFYIKHDDTYEELRQNLIDKRIVNNIQTFDLVAEKMNLPNSYKAGRYKFSSGMSNIQLVRKIRGGQWEKVIIKIKPDMSRDSVLSYLAENLEATKEELADHLNADWAKKNGFTKENVWCIFLPDHYHFNWATSGKKAIDRFAAEYNNFWTETKKSKAKKFNLTSKQACVLASIVDGEAIHVSEMSTIAGLYLNRLKKGILLQADPTVLFVVGREGRRRVLNKDLKKEDPYNTYLNTGLPPGPIFLPDKRAINAVLNPKKHNYIFMCAKPDGSFKHNFTASVAQHNRNASAYRRSLDKQGVMK